MRKRVFASCTFVSVAGALIVSAAFLMKIGDMSLKNPPNAFEQHELYGTWMAQYEGNADKLTIYEDGSFEQSYSEPPDHQFYSGKSTWYLERFPDGRVRIHLTKARYYRAGVSFFEHYRYTRPFYDPVSKSSVTMENELILDVVYRNSEQLVLYHMFVGSDEGFPLLHTRKEYFEKSSVP